MGLRRQGPTLQHHLYHGLLPQKANNLLVPPDVRRPERQPRGVNTAHSPNNSSKPMQNIDRRRVVNTTITNRNYGTSTRLPHDASRSRLGRTLALLGLLRVLYCSYRPYAASTPACPQHTLHGATHNHPHHLEPAWSRTRLPPRPCRESHLLPPRTITPCPVAPIPIQTPYPYLHTLVTSAIVISNTTDLSFPFSDITT